MSPIRRTALAYALASASAAGCGVPAEDDARFEDEASVPYDLLDAPATTAPPSSAPFTATTVELCFVRGDRLVTANRSAPPDLTLTDSVELLAAGPNDDELADELRTAIPEDPLGARVTTASGVAHVDLAARFADTEGQRQVLAVAQIVCTLTSRPGVGQVSFTLDGEPVEVPRGDGSTTANPVSREDYRQLGLA